MEEKAIRFKGIDLNYRIGGQGRAIVLLHGYLESGRIWDSFSAGLIGQFCLVIPDLPGHGLSGTWGELHGMDDLAEGVNTVLEQEGIIRATVLGHSMGGYVAMAFAELYPERLTSYVLFHSTCFADNLEKQQNRDREIGLIRCGKKRQIVQVNIPKAFSDDNQDRMREEIGLAQQIALSCPDEGIIALLNGMKKRPDRSKTLSKAQIPLMLIGGMKDNYISVDIFERLVSLAPHAEVLRLDESGHMGFLEEKERALQALISFITR